MKLKLSKNQMKVIKLMQEGWELGSDIYYIGRVTQIEKGRLQKHGLGHGDPMEEVKIVTIRALKKKELIQALPNPYPSLEPTRYTLTEKGKKEVKK